MSNCSREHDNDDYAVRAWDLLAENEKLREQVVAIMLEIETLLECLSDHPSVLLGRFHAGG